MLFLGLITYLVAIPLFSYSITPILFTRMTSLLLFFSALLSFHAYHVEPVGSGVAIYSGLFQTTQINLGLEAFLLFVGGILLLSWAPVLPKMNMLHSFTSASASSSSKEDSANFSPEGPIVNEYSLLVVFTTMGGCLLMSSSDLVSMYLSIELQSFAVYILATLYRSSESATSAGLKYFLLGGLSSALILLGTALIYSYTGVTQFESIYTLCQTTMSGSSVNNLSAGLEVEDTILEPVLLGLVLIGIGLLFKVASAPFHNWAPDVYDGVPTIVTSWLTTMPKISIFLFLLELQSGLEGTFSAITVSSTALSPVTSALTSIDQQQLGYVWKNLLLVASLLSLLIGTILGLSQYRVKRLLAYSTISHVGFLLLALAINTEDSIESFLFYLVQYSLTNVLTFFVLLAFGYTMYNSKGVYSFSGVGTTLAKKGKKESSDVTFIQELAGQFTVNPLLTASLALCLFSMAGIPPLVGFFAKQMVLYSSVHAGYYFLSLVAILVSVISASYYLKIVRVLYFDTLAVKKSSSNNIVEVQGSEAFEGTKLEGKDYENNLSSPSEAASITNVHSLTIASLTMMITFFILHPSPLLNSCYLLSLSLFYY